MPAGSVIFPHDAATVVALEAAGKAAGVFFERGLGLPPAGTQLDEAPRVAILVDSGSPVESDTSWSLRQIFGPDTGFVSTTSGSNSLQNAATDPLESFDVIYNAGQTYPQGNTARNRLRAFFERGGGYIATSQSASNFAFLAGAHPALIKGNLTQGSDGAGGGIALWANVGAGSPLTGGYPAIDNLFLPLERHAWFACCCPPAPRWTGGTWRTSTRPSSQASGVTATARRRPRRSSSTGRPSWTAGTWRLATNPFSRGDAEREWPLIGQAALWSNLTDD